MTIRTSTPAFVERTASQALAELPAMEVEKQSTRSQSSIDRIDVVSNGTARASSVREQIMTALGEGGSTLLNLSGFAQPKPPTLRLEVLGHELFITNPETPY